MSNVRTERRDNMALPPHRIHNHEIDYEACRIVTMKFESDWELRDVTGRDFGVDKIGERFENGYATSEMVMLQIKGTESMISEQNPKFSVPTKTLLYAEMFSAPFLLIYCSINNPEQCYYLWLQEYICVRLNFENKNWRQQETNMVYFPAKNILGSNYSKEHLRYISQFPKFKDSWIQYYVSVADLGYYLPQCFCYEEMDIAEVKYTMQGIIQKTKNAIEKSKHIPKRFLSEHMHELVELVSKIEEADEMPKKEDYLKVILFCNEIKASMEALSMRFDANHLRLLYEIEGTADF